MTESERTVRERTPEAARLLIRVIAALVVVLVLAGAIMLVARAWGVRPTTLGAYQGLGSWVDIYDTPGVGRSHRRREGHAGSRVRTVFVETGNSKSKTAIFKPQAQAEFVQALIARGMRVVACTCPT